MNTEWLSSSPAPLSPARPHPAFDRCWQKTAVQVVHRPLPHVHVYFILTSTVASLTYASTNVVKRRDQARIARVVPEILRELVAGPHVVVRQLVAARRLVLVVLLNRVVR